MALNRFNLRLLFIILVLELLSSCSTTRQSSVVNEYDSDSFNNTNIDLSVSLGKFVETVDLNKLCNPLKLYVMFSLDSTGKVYDSDFKPTMLSDKNCIPDTVYMNTMKIKFENQMPLWKTKVLNDSIKMVRLSIPVTFN